MKRFLLLAAACCFLLASCSSGGVKPTGDPEKDAKALMDFQTQKTKEMTVKTVADALMPVSGKVIEINPDLEAAPENVNKDPYGAGWLIKVEMTNPSEVDALLDAAAYEGICK